MTTALSGPVRAQVAVGCHGIDRLGQNHHFALLSYLMPSRLPLMYSWVLATSALAWYERVRGLLGRRRGLGRWEGEGMEGGGGCKGMLASPPGGARWPAGRCSARGGAGTRIAPAEHEYQKSEREREREREREKSWGKRPGWQRAAVAKAHRDGARADGAAGGAARARACASCLAGWVLCAPGTVLAPPDSSTTQ